MRSKRRAGGRADTRDSAVSRLGRRRTRERYPRLGATREWVRDPASIQLAVHAPRFRRAVVGFFFLAVAFGTLASPIVVEVLQGNDQSTAPILVHGVAVQGNQRLSAAAVAKASGVAPDGLASEVDCEQVALNLESHPWIRNAHATLLPGGKLVIRIEEREPVGLVRGRAAEGEAIIWRLIDGSGTPFASTRAENWSRLPRFRSQRVLTTGEIDPALIEALEIARQMSGRADWRPTSREIELPTEDAGRGWVLHSRTLPRTIILGEEELEPRLERLALLLDSELPSARGAEEIDLRFAGLAVLRSGSSSR
ncbi:MAG: FtsQ-type POTRA domain-containing protein [Deltaproteobacteria bacterium]|nr:FtsQ-type POTRA domain-containing protein [Deltaproteobacteria bacterium]